MAKSRSWSAGPELPSDTGHCGASDPSPHLHPPPSNPRLCGGDAAVGERMDMGKSKEKEGGAETQSHILLFSLQNRRGPWGHH